MTMQRLPFLRLSFVSIGAGVPVLAALMVNPVAAPAEEQMTVHTVVGAAPAQVAAENPLGTAASPVPMDRLEWHIPDPESARKRVQADLERSRRESDKAGEILAGRMLERLDSIRRPNQLHLTLEEVIRRALAHNYVIQTVSFSPAIETTRVVEAETAFDAVFFTNIQKQNIDRPTGSQLLSTDLDFFNLTSGVRKLLAPGTQVSARYSLSRTKQAFAFQIINPEYFSSVSLEMRQPLLRGFGVDFNRSLIVIAQNNKRISDLTFRRQIRDILRQTEEAYWRLVQARRDVVVSARELADFEGIYDYLIARKAFDITPVQIASTKADLEFALAEFVGRRAAVFDAEDRLIAVMNDPEVNLADDIEIVPDDFPHTERIVVDRLTEVQTALDRRTEIKEQELAVNSARVSVGRAKNAELPQLDVTFRSVTDGLGGNADQAFDKMTSNNFIEYFITVDFEIPVGNRGPRAAHRRARLQHAQAVAQLRRTFEDIILDVNLAVRRLDTSYDQILPSLDSTEAREREVNSLVARAERKDINTLRSELGARRSLASTRRTVLGVLVDYSIAIVDLERAKGTLLPYHGVVIATDGTSDRP